MSACKGMNCGCTDGVSHSAECRAEYAAALAGGRFVKDCADAAGAKLVPVEATWEMIAKGSLLALGRNLNEETLKRVWAGMLSVSPAIDTSVSVTSTHARGGSE